MLQDRQNDIPEFGEYISDARQAIEQGLLSEEQSGDKQAGDGIVAVPTEDIHNSLEIVRELKESSLKGELDINKLNMLDEILSNINSSI
ncbi:hypothetical protein GOM49_05330 [Clostridium bovifaecis]|uniref:Uncharacterized protein n=1 Tax=Clostridium bovifaecis TaxID=2184719 RepID=A0A6I6F2E7_9CLOT|nr:hypothetical protein GOM49_05330 [Clostridium bovifaecis]